MNKSCGRERTVVDGSEAREANNMGSGVWNEQRRVQC